mmetsp:Transcript_16127/g.37390  ORF Transcript_16127/g.37390 Transcript_16127/m.37390 type:complete len:884 (-) Transcript_16127:291-2942(-)
MGDKGGLVGRRCGPEAMRRGVAENSGSGRGLSRRATVELYGLNIKVILSTDLAETALAPGEEEKGEKRGRELNVSKGQTVRELKETIMKTFGIEGKDVRLWDYFQQKPFSLLDVPSRTLGDVNIMENNDLLVELPDASGNFSIKKDPPAHSSTYSSYGSSSNGYGAGGAAENAVVSTVPPPARGVCGLQNLGNTCFMNSTLQCLSNTPPLREYFSSGRFLQDMNRTNPLGHEGKLAESFGELTQLMWPDPKVRPGALPCSSLAPRGFKYQMGRFRPEFQGFQQHDSSELMNFLLDGLHEDLNRVVDKPYVEAVEGDGTKPDTEMADLFLEGYRKRNDSVIHDLFRGQFKSTLVCPSCQNVSVTFDPYTMVSLPLTTATEEKQAFFKVQIWRNPASSCPSGGGGGGADGVETSATAAPGGGRWRPQTKRVGVPKGSKAGELRKAVAEAAGVSANRIALCQVMRSYVFKVLDDLATLDYIHGNAVIVAHEVADSAPFQLTDRAPSSAYSSSYSSSYGGYGSTAPPPETPSSSANSAVTVYFRRLDTATTPSTYYYSSSYARKNKTLFGAPLLLSHPKETTPKALYEAVARAISPPLSSDPAESQSKETGGGVSQVCPSVFKLFVAKDVYGSSVDAEAVDGKSEVPIDRGMKPKVTLVLEFEDGAPEALAGSFLPGIPGVALPAPSEASAASAASAGAAGGGEGDGPSGGDGGAAAMEEAEEEEEEAKGSGGLPLRACFDLFSTPEKLSPEDVWYCGKCKDHVQATKTMELWSVPDVLVLHLKRFSYNRYSRDKLETEVDFPLDGFDLSELVKGPSNSQGELFDCVAVSNHMGSLGGGHYTASARNVEDGKWYKFNDSSTSEMRPEAVNSGNVYLLVYVRRGKFDV